MRKIFLNNTTIILAALAAGILVGLWTKPLWISSISNAHPLLLEHAAPAPAPAATASYSFEEDVSPVRLIIPSLNINTNIEKIGLTPDGTMDVAHSYIDVGWYKYGPYPGAPGNALIEGHLDTRVSPYAIFYYLYKLKPGDDVEVVDARGRTVTFVVTDNVLFPYNSTATEIFGPSTESHLNLITCDGAWIPSQQIYDKRRVVFTKRVQ